MAALINHIIKKHRGVAIYKGANTHPGSTTTSMVVFKADIGQGEGIERFRYERRNAISYTLAMCAALQYINKHMSV